jgi:NAD+ synthase (glutamine-hydrolysing)
MQKFAYICKNKTFDMSASDRPFTGSLGANSEDSHAQGFLRVASAVPEVTIANVAANVEAITATLNTLKKQDVRVAVFPELCLTGYTCGDLFHQAELLGSVTNGLERLKVASANCAMMFVVGAPLMVCNALYNCAVAFAGGEIVAIVPKTYLPNYNEFYERRWFASASDLPAGITTYGSENIPFGTDIIIDVDGVGVAIEICEDLWTAIPPSTYAALNGAEVMLNLSASNDLIGKYAYLKSLISQHSARCLGAYVYSSAGFGESTTDLSFDGKAIIYENGTLLAESKRWQRLATAAVADIDIQAIRRDRMHIMSFNDTRRNEQTTAVRRISSSIPYVAATGLMRHVDPHPFVPDNGQVINERCEEIINIQVSGLAQRLHATHTKNIVVGISGGLDSTLALLVAVRTFDALGLDREGITGVTMPGFGTTDRTHDNAVELMKSLGVSMREISISAAVKQHFADIGHDMSNHDVTYENSQARERTQLLMDIANQVSGMVLGTGDLSELALGWATYNGDHMSMYGVNGGVPKTLVKHLVKWCAQTASSQSEHDTLLDIIDTPISPELIPADDNGNIKQKTEDLVGPYELHDFFIYYTLRYGFSPRRVYYLARIAFADTYSTATILHWLRTFYRRFFTQQFKRSCLPDGPKVGSVCLSPRGDWRMPSDASSAAWLAEVDTLTAD